MLQADVEVERRSFTVRAALAAGPGERLALFGPSGAGKTTLLEAIAGLVRPSRGRITLGGRVLTDTGPPPAAVPAWRRKIGLLRQDPGLFPHLSVRENLRYARSAEDSAVASLAGSLGIGSLLDARPGALSGGQAHRVALGRLLLAHCDALLLDEPYTGLDAPMRRSLTELVVDLIEERGLPAILVAHELEQAQAFAHRLIVLDQGAVLQSGTPEEIVLRPARRRVAELVGYTAFVPVPAPGPGELTAGLHPDRLLEGALPEAGLVLDGIVTAVRPSGALWETAIGFGSANGDGRPRPVPAAPGAGGGGPAGPGAAGPGAAGIPARDGGGQPVAMARLRERHETGSRIVVTAVSPPIFGADGAAVAERAGAR